MATRLSYMLKAKSSSTHQSGFTLIELIAVIVILGALAATAVPRFVDMSSAANIAVIKSMGGAILSAADLVHAKSIIQGVENEPLANTDLDGDGNNDVEVKYGYPSGHRNNGIPKIMGGSFSSQWTWSGNVSNSQFWLTTASLGGRTGVYVNNTAVMASGCYIHYIQASSLGGSPTINYITTNC